jgi:Holliday junction resolvase RusA-like endonuclease
MTGERHFMILGAPTTKKTSQRIVYAGRGAQRRAYLIPASKSKTWERMAEAAMLSMRHAHHWPMHEGPVQVKAIFYRPWNTTGDLTGYMQALADALEGAKVIANDRLIVSWDGTRLAIDKAHPRVEVWLRAYEPEVYVDALSR